MFALQRTLSCVTEVSFGPGVEQRRERPPWIRLLRMTGTNWPYAVWWWPSDACWACGLPTVMEGRMRRAGLDMSRSPRLCGACGATRVWPVVFGGTSETPIEGSTWTPPDEAVAELRRLAFNRH
jgi:hypothetical protein